MLVRVLFLIKFRHKKAFKYSTSMPLTPISILVLQYDPRIIIGLVHSGNIFDISQAILEVSLTFRQV